MGKIFYRELLFNIKNLIIWSVVVGGLGFACVLMYRSMEGDMKEMADAFSNMGAFSDAFGMSTLSIASLKGFFATEVGAVHGLGSAMFAAITAISILSKEEDGHSGEFLFALPVSRKKVVAAKGLCVLSMLGAFTLICGALYISAVAILGGELPMGEFAAFMFFQLLMNVEIAAICFALSSLSGKNRTGAGLGVAMFFYFYDVIGRVVPDLKDYLFLGPFAMANASEIFTGADIRVPAFITAGAMTVCCVLFAFACYDRRDLAG